MRGRTLGEAEAHQYRERYVAGLAKVVEGSLRELLGGLGVVVIRDQAGDRDEPCSG
ncbi:MAG: hypothetical protein AB1816_21200 [Bacillota bacterium]